jgi:hypothetical protein
VGGEGTVWAVVDDVSKHRVHHDEGDDGREADEETEEIE